MPAAKSMQFSMFPAACLFLFAIRNSAAVDPAPVFPQPADEPAFAERTEETVCGWTVLIDKRLRERQAGETKRALELLEAQLKEIEQVLPPAATAKLRTVKLYFSVPYPGSGPRAEYHPGAGWLRRNGRDPAMAKGVEFTNIAIFEREVSRMPNFALHELAHAWHDQVLDRGFGNEELQKAYARMKDSGTYQNVERRFGSGRPGRQEAAYALTNPMEYFAESSEAFFSTNDFFPFHRQQLKSHDPEMEKLLLLLWGVQGE